MNYKVLAGAVLTIVVFLAGLFNAPVIGNLVCETAPKFDIQVEGCK